MNIVDSRLKPHRPNDRHAQQFDPLLEAKVATIDSPAIELGKTIAIDRIIEEECKIREQIQSIVLAVRVRKQLTTCGGVIVIVQVPRRSECVASFIRIDGTEPVQKTRTHCTEGNFTGAIPFGMKEGCLETHLVSSGQIRRDLAQQIGPIVLIVVEVRAVRIEPLGGE
ncbi:MAG: hypothetical protein HP496_05665 [Nitrospira sp.]|nr:hypothetical protein [Nitrospira sp.]